MIVDSMLASTALIFVSPLAAFGPSLYSLVNAASLPLVTSTKGEASFARSAVSSLFCSSAVIVERRKIFSERPD